MSNRFDLEQQILDAWKITDEIGLVFENVMDKDLSKDELANVLLGLKSLYDLKFNRLWDTFEQCLSNRELV